MRKAKVKGLAPDTWDVERGTWNVERGTWHLVPLTLPLPFDLCPLTYVSPLHNRIAICLDRNLPLQIRPQHPGPDLFEALNDLGRRVTERVAPSGADERNLRAPFRQEL